MTFTIASGMGTFIRPIPSATDGFVISPPANLHDPWPRMPGYPILSFTLGGQHQAEKLTQGILPRKSLGIIAKFSTANLMIGLGAGLIIPLIPTWFYLRFNVTDVFSGPLVAASNIIMGLTALAAPASPNVWAW